MFWHIKVHKSTWRNHSIIAYAYPSNYHGICTNDNIIANNRHPTSFALCAPY